MKEDKQAGRQLGRQPGSLTASGQAEKQTVKEDKQAGRQLGRQLKKTR
jgi:hypothetical protein